MKKISTYINASMRHNSKANPKQNKILKELLL